MLSSPEAKNKQSALYRIASLIKPHKTLFSLGIIALALGSAINLIFPEIIRRLANQNFWLMLEKYPYEIALSLLLLFLVQAFCFYYRSLFFNLIGLRVVKNIRQQIYESFLARELLFFDNHSVGELVARLSSDTVLLQDAISYRMSVFIRYGFQVICGLAMMSWISLKLTLIIVLTIPLIVVVSRFFAKKLRKASSEQQTLLALCSSIANETLSQLRVVKSFNQETREIQRYLTANNNTLESATKRAHIAAFFSSFISFLLNATLIGLLLYGLLLVKVTSLSAGDLIAFVLYGTIVAVSFAFLINSISEFIQALGASDRIFEFLSEPHSTYQAQSKISQSSGPSHSGDIVFKDVSFSYPSRPTIKVLDNVNLTFANNKVTALVGPSGAGKSSIVSLLLKFYKTYSGSILINDKDINHLTDQEIRSLISYVPQEPQLFSISLLENVAYGNPLASMQDIEVACRQANILDFINSLPKKFNTLVGEKGFQLSTGQRQRIAIARALLKQSPIIILDEATASLDSENEAHIQEAIKNLASGRTTIIIAHRLSTVKKADHLVVLEQGKVIQVGSHDTLVQIPGLYRQLVERQELVIGQC
jgi:ABC-type multidrug transport system fused ATPase/permease subunit